MMTNPRRKSFHRTCLALAISQVLALPAQAATIEVTSELDDNGAGCTLREAVVSINMGSDPTNGCGGADFGMDDVIGFNASLAGKTITLSGTQLSIDPGSDVSIDGLGQDQLTISASNLSRVFYANSATVSLNSLTITQGSAGADNGGGIYAFRSSITLSNSTVSGSSANSGGGVSSFESSITLTNCTVWGNSVDARGGGVSAYDSSITLTNSTVSGNTAPNDGGGIFAASTSVTLTNSTVSGNSATDYGGAFYASGSSSINLTNSTVSGNSATVDGGAFFASGSSSINLTNSTVSGNSATVDGGAFIARNSSNLSLTNSIVSGNGAGNLGDEIYFSGNTYTVNNNNLFGNSDGGKNNADAFYNFSPGASDIAATSDGTRATTLSSILNPLADNEGPTETHALVPNSPAIDEGDDAACAAAPVNDLDQRGVARPIGLKCDIGAFEGSVEGTSLFVIPLPNGKMAIVPL